MSTTENVLKYNSNTCIGKLDPNQDECLDKEQCGQSEKPTTILFLVSKNALNVFMPNMYHSTLLPSMNTSLLCWWM